MHKKLPLLMLPGWGMGPWVWQPIQSHLAQRFELILPAWTAVMRNEEFATRVQERIETEQWGEFALWGWSLGSLVALQLAAQYPHRVVHLILCGATARFTVAKTDPTGSGWPRRVVERMKRNLQQDLPATLAAFYAAQFTEAEREAGYLAGFWSQAVRWEAKTNAANLALGLDYLMQTDQRGLLPRVTTPTLLIHGDCDAICPVAAAEFIATHLAGKSVLQVMKGVGHLPFWSRPTETLQILDQFINGMRP